VVKPKKIKPKRIKPKKIKPKRIKAEGKNIIMATLILNYSNIQLK